MLNTTTFSKSDISSSSWSFHTDNVTCVTLEPDLSQIGFEFGSVRIVMPTSASAKKKVRLLHVVRLHDGVDKISLFFELGSSQNLLDCGIQVVIVEKIDDNFGGWTAKECAGIGGEEPEYK